MLKELAAPSESLTGCIEREITQGILTSPTFNNPLRRTEAFSHITSVPYIAKKVCQKIPLANKEIVALGAWLHDSGFIWADPQKPHQDHAIRGEVVAREILTRYRANEEVTEAVARIVRRHRNRDIPPQTLEEKIVAAADSASHIVAGTYPHLMRDITLGNERERALICLGKIRRDIRDINLVPQLAEEIQTRAEHIEKWLLAILNS